MIGEQTHTPVDALDGSHTIPLNAMITSWGVSQERSSEFGWDEMDRARGQFAGFRYTLAGAGRLRYDGMEYAVPMGKAMLLHAPRHHRCWVPAHVDSWRFAFACFTGNEALRILSAIEEQNGPVFDLSPNADAIRVLRRILRLNDVRGEHSRFELSRLAYEFTISLLEDTLSPGGDEPDWLRRVKRYAAANVAEDISVSKLAAVAGYSRFHFTHVFTEHEKMSPQDYVTELRTGRAKELLYGTDLSIKEIAVRCGFSSASYFCRRFRKHVGRSPGAYRKRFAEGSPAGVTAPDDPPSR